MNLFTIEPALINKVLEDAQAGSTCHEIQSLRDITEALKQLYLVARAIARAKEARSFCKGMDLRDSIPPPYLSNLYTDQDKAAFVKYYHDTHPDYNYNNAFNICRVYATTKAIINLRVLNSIPDTMPESILVAVAKLTEEQQVLIEEHNHPHAYAKEWEEFLTYLITQKDLP